MAVTYQEYNPNDDRFKILAVQKAKIRMEQSEREWKNAQQMYEKKYISHDEYVQFETQYQNDKINYEQYMLSVIYDKPHVTILSAFKSQDESGQIRVDLTIANSSGGNYAMEELALDDIKKNSKVSPTTMYNLYVSLMDDKGSIISQPYEYRLKSLAIGKSASLHFTLLKDVEDLTVSVNYGDHVTEKHICLKRRGTQNTTTITPDFFSQDIQTGDTGNYRLEIEYFGDIKQNLVPRIVGLPDDYTWTILSEANAITVSDIQFSPAQAKQTFVLQVTVPEKVGNNIVLEKPIRFSLQLENSQGVVAGKTDLQLTPSGKAMLLVNLPNLYLSGLKGKDIVIWPMTIENRGMKNLTNLSLDITLPPNWEYRLEPKQIAKIAPQQKVKVKVIITPSSDSQSGIYEMRLKVNAKNVDKIVQTTEQQVKIEITEKTNIFLLLLGILLAIGLVTAIVISMIKIAKN